jgi:hypothetical protein
MRVATVDAFDFPEFATRSSQARLTDSQKAS